MRVALIAAIVTHVAVVCLVVSLRKPPTIIEARTTIPISVSIPITVQPPSPSPQPPPPPASTARPSCPSPNTDAPPVAMVAPPKDVNHVFASRTNASWIAAWDEHHVQVSTDGGKTFARMLDGPGDVSDVTFDCFGHAIVLRDAHVGIRDGMRESWGPVPGIRGKADDPAALIGGGPDVIVIGVGDPDEWGARMAVSPDAGTTWWYRDLVQWWETSTSSGYQASDRSIHVALTTADCMSDPVYWMRIRDGKVETDELGSVGHIVLDGDRAYIDPIGDDVNPPQSKRFGDEKWRPTKSRRAKQLMSGSVDAAGRVWSIDETKDGEAAWAVVRY